MSDLRVTNLRGRTAGSAPQLPDGAVVTGVVTATSFAGNVTGNADTATTATNAQGLTGNPTISVTDITATGNVSIAGTLTYEDVKNVDSIGIITARSGIDVTSGGINVGTATTITDGGLNVTGVVTATSFSGDTNTATRFPATDTITLETSGSEALRIDSSGNVRIGVVSGQGRLDVATAGDSSIVLANETTYTDGLKRGRITKKSDNSFLIQACDSASAVDTIFNRTVSAESMRIDSFGRLLVNQNISSPSASNIGAVLQVNEGSGVAMSINRNSGADAFAANLCFRKSRSSSADGTTLVVANDALGQIQFMGTDGDQAHPGAVIQAAVDGTASNDVMPGRLMFFTNGGGTTAGERMRISSTGVVTVKNGAVAEIDTLTSASTVTPDFAASCNFTLTLGTNVLLENPSNLTAGQSGSIFLIQDGTGSRTLSFGTYWDFAGGTPPTISTVGGSVDRLDYIVRSSTSIHAVVTLAYS